jgi:hypothetical protein
MYTREDLSTGFERRARRLDLRIGTSATRVCTEMAGDRGRSSAGTGEAVCVAGLLGRESGPSERIGVVASDLDEPADEIGDVSCSEVEQEDTLENDLGEVGISIGTSNSSSFCE